MTKSLVFATHNSHKLKEVQAMMPAGIELLSLDDINCTQDIIEDAPTIEGNAQLKAKYVKEHYGYDCFADDTGLEVTALNGAPGVYSARYAGEEKDSEANMDKLLYRLEPFDDRSAQFKTAIALKTDQTEQLFLGICKGTITFKRHGSEGFGYDPIFMPDGFNTTFAQMTLQEKGAISHRGLAFKKLLLYLSR